jgi:5-methylcytosine-specific restriction endonuclease McrA
MSNGHLKHSTVLVLNRNWQAINVNTPMDALSMMYADTATGLYVKENEFMNPMKWQEWINLPYDENYSYIKTIGCEIKIPKVIILSHYNKVPKKRPKFTKKNIWLRDGGVCQYTGKKLSQNEGNIDHVLPKSRGGVTSWTNCVLTHHKVNAMKADMTPDEAGLKLLKQPIAPKDVPTSVYIKNIHNIKEWNMFL